MLTLKQIERASTMFNSNISKYNDVLLRADFDWYLVETFDARSGFFIQELVPWCRLDFK
jgi:hypothetical protein